MPPIRVLHIADYAAPYKGNFLASLTKLKAEMESSGGRLLLALPQRADQRPWFGDLKKEFGDDLVLIPPVNVLSKVVFFRKTIRSRSINIIHTHFTHFDMSGFWAALFSGAGVVWHCHSDWEISYTFFRALKDFIKHRVLGLKVCHIAVSDSIQEMLLKRMAYKNRTFIVYNGIDLNRIPNGLPDRELAKKALGLDPAKFVFMIFAWAPQTKGMDIALDALRKLSKLELDKLQLVVVGREKTQQFLAEYAVDLNPDKIKLVAPVQNVFELYAAADCFCSFSRREGFSYALYESMAFGNVVLANDIPALRPLHESDAVFFRQNDVSDAAEKMRMMMNMPDAEKTKISQSNAEFVREKYNVGIWARRMIEVYKTLIRLTLKS